MIDNSGRPVSMDKEVDVFISELFSDGYEVAYFRRSEGKMHDFDGVSDYIISPTMNIVIKDTKSQELYSFQFKKEAYGFNGFSWWLHKTSADGRKFKLRILDIADVEKVRSYIDKAELPDRFVNIYKDVKVVSIYDGLNDGSMQCIHIAVDNMNDVEEGEDGLVENLSKTLMIKCKNLIKRTGFIMNDSFIYLNDDKSQLIFEAVRA